MTDALGFFRLKNDMSITCAERDVVLEELVDGCIVDGWNMMMVYE